MPPQCNAGCNAMFAVFHFVGMLGISEAAAESAASHFKYFSPARSRRLGTGRLVEKVILRILACI